MDLSIAATPSLDAWTAVWGSATFPCAIGRAGITAAKTEGDGATPAGRFVMRTCLYRADRLGPPPGVLPSTPLAADDGWCDDPADPHYNRPVKLPFAPGHETMWRTDHLYDLVVVLGHNDDPPRPGAGSAIFLHVAAGDYRPTEGCVALALPDLLTVLAAATPASAVRVPA